MFFTNTSQFGGNTDNIIPIMLKEVIPQGLFGLIAVLVLAASMSTLASVSLSSASVLSIDLYKGNIKKDASDSNVTKVMRIMCVAFVILSVVIALLNKTFEITAIAYLMSLSWGTLSGCFFGPFVLGLYSKKITKVAAITSVIGGLVFTLVFTVIFGILSVGINAGFGAILKAGVGLSPITGVLCIVFSLIITIVVSAFTKKPSNDTIVNSFEKPIENEIL